MRRSDHASGSSKAKRSRKPLAIGWGVLCAFLWLYPNCLALNPSLDISQYAHTSWKIRDGFTQGPIRAIAQTPDGYLWLGTEFGLVRFDGVRAQPWRNPAGQRLASSFIRTLLVSHDGALWIGTDGGLASWKNGAFRLYPDFSGFMIFSLLEDHSGALWVGATAAGDPLQSKLCRIRQADTRCYGEGGIFRQPITRIYEDGNGRLWACGGNGIWQFTSAPVRFQPVAHQSNCFWVIDGNDGNLLLATREGLKRIVDGKAAGYPLPGINWQFIPGWLFRDSGGSLWIGAGDRGLIHLHQSRADWFAQPDGLSSNNILSIFEDRERNVWVSTMDGLDRFRDTAVATISTPQGLPDQNIWSVLPARDGSLWIGSTSGLTHLRNDQVTIYRKPHPNASGLSPFQAAARSMKAVREVENIGLPDRAESLFEDDAGRLWITTSRGVARWSGARFSLLPGVPGGEMYSLAEDNDKNVWICSQQHGLIRVSANDKVEQIPWPQLGHRDYAIAIAADASNGIWLGFARGGVISWRQGQVRASFTAANGLGTGTVNELRYESSALWAATAGGLSRIYDGRVSTLTTSNGLPCNAIHWSVQDNDHALWLYTECGLVRIQGSELDAWMADSRRLVHPQLFDASDGARLRAPRTGWRAFGPLVAKTRDGRIWFATDDGVAVLDPRHLPVNEMPPPVHVEQITADGKAYAASDGLRLPALVRDVTIDFTALSLVAPEKVRFKYQLEGQDEAWREVVNTREVQYSNLPPRRYRFRVIASNNSGVWNQQGATLEFVIPPAWRQTNWFLGMCSAVFVVLLWALYRLRMEQLAREEKKFREAVQSMPSMAFIAGPDGSRTFINERWLAYTGCTHQQALGSGWQAAFHPEDRDRVSEKWRASLNSGEPLEYEARLRAADGQYRWFLTRVAPVYNSRGKLVKWYGAAADIEDRKRAEDALRHSEMYLAEAQNLTHSGSWVVDGKTHEVLFFSEEMYRIFGFDAHAGLPSKEQCRSRIHPEDHEGLRLATNRIFLEKQDMNAEYRILLPDGTVKHLHSLGKPVTNQKEELVEVLGTTVDITERKHAEEERERLRQLEADLAHFSRVSMLGEMAATLAHEIKQPIAAAITSANTCVRWLQHDPPELTRARAAALRVERDGTRAAQIIDHLRALYKKSPPQRELVNLNELVDVMLGLLRGEAQRRYVLVCTELAAGLPSVTADRVQMQQVLMNLLLNGLEAMADGGGELIIRTHLEEGARIVVTVSDTGIGLPKNKADRIFDAFFTTKPNGSGMGLAISRSIVESHGGRLWATMNNGRGAAFHFSLPIGPSHRPVVA